MGETVDLAWCRCKASVSISVQSRPVTEQVVLFSLPVKTGGGHCTDHRRFTHTHYLSLCTNTAAHTHYLSLCTNRAGRRRLLLLAPETHRSRNTHSHCPFHTPRSLLSLKTKITRAVKQKREAASWTLLAFGETFDNKF